MYQKCLPQSNGYQAYLVEHCIVSVIFIECQSWHYTRLRLVNNYYMYQLIYFTFDTL